MLSPMTYGQTAILAVIGVMFAFFVWERWRYDIVAFGGLIAAVLLGVVPAEAAFAGFGHPATVTVAFVLIMSQAMSNIGVSDILSRLVRPLLRTPSLHVASLCGVAAVLSSFMNNVGALALTLPVALRSADRARLRPSLVMMPLAFAAILGGLVTVIGTPPNIIIAAYRADLSGSAFTMFDFTPVGGLVALVALVFLATIGWRLLPRREGHGDARRDLFHISDYVFEVQVLDDSPLIGQIMSDAESRIGDINALILRRLREGMVIPATGKPQPFAAGDILIVESSPDDLDKLMGTLGLSLVTKADLPVGGLLNDETGAMMEAVVTPGSRLEGRTAQSIQLRRRHAVTLLAVSRQGKPFRGRLKAFRIKVGDVLLLYGDPVRLPDVFASLGCLPLARRRFQFVKRRKLALGLGLFGGAIAAATLQLVALPVALGAAALGSAAAKLISLREVYRSVDWPVIVLVGAMIPVGQALETTGATALLSNWLGERGAGWPAEAVVATLLVATMLLSAVLNNAATAVIMAPIGAQLAATLQVNSDPFLMAVAIGASCAFLTPIGHQNNALVMGPGGYRFGDYWRLGLPLEILIVAVALPTLLWVWPL